MLTSPRSQRLRRLALLTSFLFAAGVVACGSSYDPAQDGGLATGGKTGNTGGSSTGGSSTGGSSTGGSSTGGAATGGSSTGGSSTGGSSTGGSSSGGSSTGGSSTGGSATGGKGGSGTGGGSTGGKGGSSTGGSSGGGAAGCGTQTYANTYMAFFQMYCISCHTTAGRPNFSTQSGIKNASSQIKTDAVTGTKMPEGTGPKPTSDQRKALGAWLDCGAP